MDPFIGEIRPFPYNFAPVGWLYCDGSLQQISEYDVLYNLLGTTYGGDGVTTFGLPDLRGRVPTHAGNGSTLGALGGAEAVSLNGVQVPYHTHTLLVSPTGGLDTPVGNYAGVDTGTKVYGPNTGQALAADTVSLSTGGNNPHANVQPYLAIAFCISTQGIYPSQS